VSASACATWNDGNSFQVSGACPKGMLSLLRLLHHLKGVLLLGDSHISRG
jgi:hypothetical protein